MHTEFSYRFREGGGKTKLRYLKGSKFCGWVMNTTSSGSCLMADFGIGGVGLSLNATRESASQSPYSCVVCSCIYLKIRRTTFMSVVFQNWFYEHILSSSPTPVH
jgi:hypothetical protein